MAKRKQTRRQNQVQKPKWLLILVFLFGIVLIGAGLLIIRPTTSFSARLAARELPIGEAQTLYESNCAACHGNQGQGHIQLNAPALDSTEHAWHHSDEQIIGLIRNGGVQMPAIGANFSNPEIEAVVAYFKGWWTPQQRAIQPGTIGE